MKPRHFATARRMSVSVTALALAMTFSFPLAASANESAGPVSLASNPCQAEIDAALALNDLSPDATYDFICSPAQVSLEAENADGTVTSLQVTSEEIASVVDSASDQARASSDMCYISDPVNRTIVSELEVQIDFCIVYGQNGHPTNGSWARSASVDWTAYPGYPSVQNVLRLGSAFASTGDVWLWGSLTLQKQNGGFPPSDIFSSLIDLRSNSNTYPFYVGGITAYGSHAVRLDDFEITDMDYQFNAQVSNPAVHTPRFHCEPDNERCYYPNGQEAGL
jgi:hypothetical protein